MYASFVESDNAWREQFWRDGFVVPPHYAAPLDLLGEVREAMEPEASGSRDLGGTLEIRNLRGRVPAVARIADLCLPFASWIAGRPMRCTFDEVFVAWPGAPRGTSWHQDEAHGKLGRIGIGRHDTSMSFWIPLHDVDTTCGALRYVAQSHLSGLRSHRGEPGGRRFMPDTTDEMAQSVPLRAGQCVMHHGYVIHSAHANRSDTARWALAVQFRPGWSQIASRRRLGDQWMTNAGSSR